MEVDIIKRPMDKVTESEVMKVIKAAGVSEVVAEHVVASGKISEEELTEIFNRLLDGRNMPDE